MIVHIQLKTNDEIEKLENLGLKCKNVDRLLKYKIFTCECSNELYKKVQEFHIGNIENDTEKGIQ